MATVLFAWELGGNLGHFTMLLPIARELRRLGYRVVFTLGDLAVLAYCEDDFDFPVLQSPRWLPRPLGMGDALAFSDVLPGAGYFSEAGLDVLVTAWQQLFALAQADLVVCEHAPTAMLAAHIGHYRAMCIGTGFVCPPVQVDLPRFATLSKPQQIQLTARERKMLSVCNTVLTGYDKKPFLSLAELYKDIPALLCTYPELDHYVHRPSTCPTVRYLGPIYDDVVANDGEWPQKYEKNILVYLNNFVYWERQIAALSQVKANILIVALGLSPNDALEQQPDHIKLIVAPIALQPMLALANLVICHGGHGTVAAALLAGKPALIWPTQKEQGLMALRIKSQGLGNYSDVSRMTTEAITAQIESLLEEPAAHQAAQAFAKKYSNNTVATTVHNTAMRIVDFLNAKSIPLTE